MTYALVKVYEQTNQMPAMILIASEDTIRLEVVGGTANDVVSSYKLKDSLETAMVFSYVERFASNKTIIHQCMASAAEKLNGEKVV